MMCTPAPGRNKMHDIVKEIRLCGKPPGDGVIRGRPDGLIQRSGGEKKEGRLRGAALFTRSASERQAALAHTAKNCTLWATPARFFIETSQTFVALLGPVRPGVDSCRRVLKFPEFSPTTSAPPPSTTLPAGHGTTSRLKSPPAASAVTAPVTTS